MSFILGPFEALESGLWESKPDVPDFHWTDLVQQQLDTAAGNLGVLPKSEEIGTGVNDFLRSERAKTLAGIPGLEDIENKSVANLKAWLAGELPGDVQSAILRGSNAQAFGGGYQGSGMERNLKARDLGLNSYQIQQAAMPLARAYTGQEASLRSIPEWNPASMFLDPMASAQFNAQQQAAKFNRDWLANRIAAQPEPWQQSIMNSTQQAGAIGDTLFGGFLGGAIGGAAGGAGGGGGAATPANPWAPGGAASNYYGLMDPVGYGYGGGTGSNPWGIGQYHFNDDFHRNAIQGYNPYQ